MDNIEFDPDEVIVMNTALEKREKAKRRSSLKKTKPRNPLGTLDVTEANDITLAPPPRRVSFAASNFVKPFIDDPEKNTIWDNTYEEEINHTPSMELASINKESRETTENQRLANKENHTVYFEQSMINMEFTCRDESLQEQMIITREEGNVERRYENVNEQTGLEMEFTCKWQNDILEGNRVRDPMNVTFCDPQDIIDRESELKTYPKEIEKNTNPAHLNQSGIDMSFTCQFSTLILPKANSVEQNPLTNKLDGSDMDFTCNFGAQKSIVSKGQKSENVSNQCENAERNVDADIPQRTVPIDMDVTNQSCEDMEITLNQKSLGNIAQKPMKADQIPISMEVGTKQLENLNKSLGQSHRNQSQTSFKVQEAQHINSKPRVAFSDQNQSCDDMEMTLNQNEYEKVTKVREFGGIPVVLGSVSQSFDQHIPDHMFEAKKHSGVTNKCSGLEKICTPLHETKVRPLESCEQPRDQVLEKATKVKEYGGAPVALDSMSQRFDQHIPDNVLEAPKHSEVTNESGFTKTSTPFALLESKSTDRALESCDQPTDQNTEKVKEFGEIPVAPDSVSRSFNQNFPENVLEAPKQSGVTNKSSGLKKTPFKVLESETIARGLDSCDQPTDQNTENVVQKSMKVKEFGGIPIALDITSQSFDQNVLEAPKQSGITNKSSGLKKTPFKVLESETIARGLDSCDQPTDQNTENVVQKSMKVKEFGGIPIALDITSQSFDQNVLEAPKQSGITNKSSGLKKTPFKVLESATIARGLDSCDQPTDQNTENVIQKSMKVKEFGGIPIALDITSQSFDQNVLEAPKQSGITNKSSGLKKTSFQVVESGTIARDLGSCDQPTDQDTENVVKKSMKVKEFGGIPIALDITSQSFDQNVLEAPKHSGITNKSSGLKKTSFQVVESGTIARDLGSCDQPTDHNTENVFQKPIKVKEFGGIPIALDITSQSFDQNVLEAPKQSGITNKSSGLKKTSFQVVESETIARGLDSCNQPTDQNTENVVQKSMKVKEFGGIPIALDITSQSFDQNVLEAPKQSGITNKSSGLKKTPFKVLESETYAKNLGSCDQPTDQNTENVVQKPIKVKEFGGIPIALDITSQSFDQNVLEAPKHSGITNKSSGLKKTPFKVLESETITRALDSCDPPTDQNTENVFQKPIKVKEFGGIPIALDITSQSFDLEAPKHSGITNKYSGLKKPNTPLVLLESETNARVIHSFDQPRDQTVQKPFKMIPDSKLQSFENSERFGSKRINSTTMVQETNNIPVVLDTSKHDKPREVDFTQNHSNIQLQNEPQHSNQKKNCTYTLNKNNPGTAVAFSFSPDKLARLNNQEIPPGNKILEQTDCDSIQKNIAATKETGIHEDTYVKDKIEFGLAPEDYNRHDTILEEECTLIDSLPSLDEEDIKNFSCNFGASYKENEKGPVDPVVENFNLSGLNCDKKDDGNAKDKKCLHSKVIYSEPMKIPKNLSSMEFLDDFPSMQASCLLNPANFNSMASIEDTQQFLQYTFSKPSFQNLETTKNERTEIAPEPDVASTEDGILNNESILNLIKSKAVKFEFPPFDHDKVREKYEALEERSKKLEEKLISLTSSSTDLKDFEREVRQIYFRNAACEINTSESIYEEENSSLGINREATKSLREKISDVCERSDGRIDLKYQKENSYIFGIRELIYIQVELHPEDGRVAEMIPQSAYEKCSSEGPDHQYFIQSVLKKLDWQTLKSYLGPTYDILSLLDYVSLSVEEIMDFQCDYIFLQREFPSLRMVPELPDYCISFDILHRSPPIWWTIKMRMSPPYKVQQESLSLESKWGKINEEHIRAIMRKLEEGPNYLRSFLTEVQDYFNRTQLRRKL